MGSNDYYKWGPTAWSKFHEKAINYPIIPCQGDIKKVLCFYHKDFMQYIGCKDCEMDYKSIIRSYPVRTGSRLELFNWTVDVHNIINAKLGKQRISYEQAYQLWCVVFPIKYAINSPAVIYPRPDFFDPISAQIEKTLTPINGAGLFPFSFADGKTLNGYRTRIYQPPVNYFAQYY